jgi:hypothetical protein
MAACLSSMTEESASASSIGNGWAGGERCDRSSRGDSSVEEGAEMACLGGRLIVVGISGEDRFEMKPVYSGAAG